MNFTSENNTRKTVIISYPEALSREEEAINSLFHSGLNYFHLRKPNMNQNALEQLICKIPKTFHPHIILHNHYALVKKYGLKGIHINQYTKDKGVEKEFKNHHISISTHSFIEIKNLQNEYNYAFLSPIFDSLSKAEYKTGFTNTELEQNLKKAPGSTEVIALGGITPETVEKVKHLPFQGFAALGYIWQSFAEDQDISTLKQSIQQIKQAIHQKTSTR